MRQQSQYKILWLNHSCLIQTSSFNLLILIRGESCFNQQNKFACSFVEQNRVTAPKSTNPAALQLRRKTIHTLICCFWLSGMVAKDVRVSRSWNGCLSWPSCHAWCPDVKTCFQTVQIWPCTIYPFMLFVLLLVKSHTGCDPRDESPSGHGEAGIDRDNGVREDVYTLHCLNTKLFTQSKCLFKHLQVLRYNFESTNAHPWNQLTELWAWVSFTLWTSVYPPAFTSASLHNQGMMMIVPAWLKLHWLDTSVLLFLDSIVQTTSEGLSQSHTKLDAQLTWKPTLLQEHDLGAKTRLVGTSFTFEIILQKNHVTQLFPMAFQIGHCWSDGFCTKQCVVASLLQCCFSLEIPN